MALAASFVKSTSPGWARLLEQPVKLRRGVVGTDGLRVLSVGRGVTAALGGAKAAGGCGGGYGSKNGAGDAKLTEGRPQPSTAWPYTPYGQAAEDTCASSLRRQPAGCMQVEGVSLGALWNSTGESACVP